MDVATNSTTATDIERRLRIDLAACFRIVALNGWDDAIYTHFSVRIPGPEHHFLINPFGLLFEEITASNLVKIDCDGNKVDDSPYEILPAAFIIHSAIHMAREDAHCVLHLHTNDNMAVSSMEGGVLPLSNAGMAVHGDVAILPYDAVAVDLEERLRLQRVLGDKHMMLMQNHGTLSVGATIPEAYFRARFLEQACSVQVRALAAVGREGLAMPGPGVTEEIAALVKRQTPHAANALLWPAILRKLDRDCPDYKT